MADRDRLLLAAKKKLAKFQQVKEQDSRRSSVSSVLATARTNAPMPDPHLAPESVSTESSPHPPIESNRRTIEVHSNPPIDDAQPMQPSSTRDTSQSSPLSVNNSVILSTTDTPNGSSPLNNNDIEIQSMNETITVLISERAELKLQNERLANDLKTTTHLPRQQQQPQPKGNLSDVQNAAVLRLQLEESKQRETTLKAQHSELELMVKEWRDSSDRLLLERRDLITRISIQEEVITELRSQLQENDGSMYSNSNIEELERTRKLLHDKQDVIESVTMSLAETQRRNEELQAQLESYVSVSSGQLESERQSRVIAESESATLANQLASLSETISTLTGQNETLTSSLKQSEFSKSTMSQRISELSSALEAQRGELEEARRQSDALTASSERSQKLLNENKMLFAQLAELRERTIALNNEKAVLVDELEIEKRRANTLQSELSSASLNGNSNSPDPVVDTQMVERLQADIARYQVEMQRLQFTIDANHHSGHNASNVPTTVVPDTANVANLRQTLMRTREELEAARGDNVALREQLQAMKEADSGVDSDEERLSTAQNLSTTSNTRPVIITATTEQQTDPIDTANPSSVASGGQVSSSSAASGVSSPVLNDSNSPSDVVNGMESNGDQSQQQQVITQYENQFQSQQQKLAELYNNCEGSRSRIVELEKMCRAAEAALIEERKINTLLSAEVDVVQDYISLYHQERKALQEQMDRLVARVYRNSPEMAESLRESATLPPTPARFRTDSDSGVYTDNSAPTKRSSTKRQSIAEASLAERRVKGSGIHGMLLRGVVLGHGPCPKCSSLNTLPFT
ncbi:hypothetical protein SeMB42_g01742 [Synchytrium endobioticum]|uniref:Uncharacterized protein n=1 Tax=Synchytrium endobioticum TaxID=286115 RepID=A0A507DJT8_9FUNG|nr:hypothetical protein SeMB42_g01742 [Synchytrium endobioticum]